MSLLQKLKAIESWRWMTLLVLLLFVVGAAMLVADNERQRLMETSRQHIDAELDLIGLAMHKAITEGRYGDVEAVVERWGQHHQNGSIVVLNVTLPGANEPKLAHYVRAEPQRETAYYTQRDIVDGGAVFLRVETIRDFSDEEQAVRELRQRFLAAALCVVVLIWLCIQYIAHLTLRGYQNRIQALEAELLSHRAAADNLAQRQAAPKIQRAA